MMTRQSCDRDYIWVLYLSAMTKCLNVSVLDFGLEVLGERLAVESLGVKCLGIHLGVEWPNIKCLGVKC